MTSPLDLDGRSSESADNELPRRPAPPAVAGPSRLVGALLRVGLLPVLLVAAIAIFAAIEPRFLGPLNGTNIGRQLSFLLIITMAQMLVLVTAEIDMSVGSTIALTSVVSTTVMVRVGGGGLKPVVLGVLAGLALGLLIGLINGLIVAKFRVPSFIVTIGSGAIAFGFALIISSGSPITGLPKTFTRGLGSSSIGSIPLSLAIALALFGLLYLLLNWTTAGRYLYAVGGGENAARLVGVPVFRSKVLAFVLCSTLTSLSAILLTARVSSGEPNLGSEFVIYSIAAAVLGGTSFFGGTDLNSRPFGDQ